MLTFPVMILVLFALVLVGLKFAGVDPVAAWSWWWILSPLAVAFLWFEVFEKMLGFHRREDAEPDHETRRRERSRAVFGLEKERRKRR